MITGKLSKKTYKQLGVQHPMDDIVVGPGDLTAVVYPTTGYSEKS